MVFSKLLNFKVEPLLHPAKATHKHWVSYPDERGIVLKVSGYSSGLEVVVYKFVTKMMEFAETVTQLEFQIIIRELVAHYENILVDPKLFAK